jgi:hypothetical protein
MRGYRIVDLSLPILDGGGFLRPARILTGLRQASDLRPRGKRDPPVGSALDS